MNANIRPVFETNNFVKKKKKNRFQLGATATKTFVPTQYIHPI